MHNLWLTFTLLHDLFYTPSDRLSLPVRLDPLFDLERQGLPLLVGALLSPLVVLVGHAVFTLFSHLTAKPRTMAGRQVEYFTVRHHRDTSKIVATWPYSKYFGIFIFATLLHKKAPAY